MEKQPDEIYCPQCGKPIKKETVICPNCGVQVKELKVVATQPPANQIQNIQTVIHKRPLSIVLIVLLGIAFLIALIILSAFHLALLAIIIYFPIFIIITFNLIFVNLRKNKNRTISFLISTCVLIAILIVSLIGFSNIESKKNVAKAIPQNTAVATTAKSVFHVGDNVDSNGTIITVTKFTKSSGGDFFNELKEGMEYVIITINIKNSTDRTVSYNPFFDFKMQNSKGQITGPAFTFADQKTALSSVELVPNGEVSGTVTFEEPKNDPGLILLYQPFLSEAIKINIKAATSTVSPEAKTEKEVIPTELEAREKIEDGIGKLTNLDSDRQSLRRVADWLPAGWRTGVLVVRDDNPTRWGKKPEMYYYLMVTSQGGVLYVTWGAANIYYYKSWTEVKSDIARNYPLGADWADGSFIAAEVWKDDPLWQKEELWKDDTYWKDEFWDYINNLKNP